MIRAGHKWWKRGGADKSLTCGDVGESACDGVGLAKTNGPTLQVFHHLKPRIGPPSPTSTPESLPHRR